MPKLHFEYGHLGTPLADWILPIEAEEIIQTYLAGVDQKIYVVTGMLIDHVLVGVVDGRLNPLDLTFRNDDNGEFAHLNKYCVWIVDCEPTQITPWGWHQADNDWGNSLDLGSGRLQYSMNLRKAEKEKNHDRN